MVARIPVWSRQQLILGGMIILCIVAGFANLAEYLMLDLNLILAGIAAPFVLRVRQPGQFSYRYGFLAVAALALFAGVHMQIFFLLAVGGTIAFLVESSKGKMGILPLVLLVLMSSVPAYLADVMTFPLRLWMSEQTAWMLSGIGSNVSHHGNVFYVNGNEFAVDAACMGLQSLVTGLIITTLLISFTQQRTQRLLSGWISLMLLAATLALVVVGNFIRMISLVLFQSMPDTLSHELIGVFGLLLYVILPMALVTRWVVRKWGKSMPEPSGKSIRLTSPQLLVSGLLILGITFFNVNRKAYLNDSPDQVVSSLELPGFEKTLLENGIAKFEQDQVLIYLKPPVHFWGSDHSPNICWRASGFQLYGMSESMMGTQKVYTAELRKGSEVFYTAWWYENGEMKTHSQLEWRLQRLQGAAPFRLVNVTASSPDQLVEECLGLLSIGQAGIVGYISSSITGDKPTGYVYIEITDTDIPKEDRITMTDSLGYFRFGNLEPNKDYLLEVTVFGYGSQVFEIQTEAGITETELTLKSSCDFNKEQAEADWEIGNAKLLLVGSIAPTANSKADDRFERKYEVRYHDFFCSPPSPDCIKIYNRVIFKLMDKKYGKTWRKKVRPDVKFLD